MIAIGARLIIAAAARPAKSPGLRRRRPVHRRAGRRAAAPAGNLGVRLAPSRAARTMPTIPADPLSRFLAIARALTDEKAWWEDRSIMRYAALPLVTTAGDPKAL